MEIFKEIQPLKAFIKAKRKSGLSIGLVPTMGALHAGHQALIQTCQQENDLTICSIYVNPTQFNNKEDLVNYPRNLGKDLQLLENEGCHAVFCPADDQMYAEKNLLKFSFGHLDRIMEGEHRPGHFNGVALIVGKLFNIVAPDKAYFGQKDWQQYVVIRHLVEELKFNLTLRSVPTVRENDGLALSSRNLRLNEAQRAQANVFFQALQEAKSALIAGEPVEQVKSLVKDIAERNPEVKLEYFELAERENLTVLNSVTDANAPILCIAGYVGKVRLIDNMFLDLR